MTSSRPQPMTPLFVEIPWAVPPGHPCARKPQVEVEKTQAEVRSVKVIEVDLESDDESDDEGKSPRSVEVSNGETEMKTMEHSANGSRGSNRGGRRGCDSTGGRNGKRTRDAVRGGQQTLSGKGTYGPAKLLGRRGV